MSKSIIKNISINTSANLFNILVAVITMGLLTRALEKSDMGLYVLFTILTQIAAVLLNFGSGVTITREYADLNSDEQKKEELLNVVNIIKIWGLLLLLFFLMLNIIFNDNLPKYINIIFFINLFFVSFNQIPESILAGLGYFDKLSFNIIISSIFKLALFLSFFFLNLNYLSGFLVITVLSTILSSSLYFYHNKALKYIHINRWVVLFKSLERKSAKLKVRKTVAKMLPLYFNDILTILMFRADSLLISSILNTEMLAIYNVASKIPEQLKSFFQQIIKVLFPELTKYKSFGEIGKEKIGFIVYLVSIISFCIMILFYLYGKYILLLLFSEKYLESFKIMNILMNAALLGFIGNILGTSLIAYGYSKTIFFLNIFISVISIILYTIFGMFWGLIGYGYAILFTIIIAQFGTYAIFSKKIGGLKRLNVILFLWLFAFTVNHNVQLHELPITVKFVFSLPIVFLIYYLFSRLKRGWNG